MLDKDICIPVPTTIEQLKDENYLKNKVDELNLKNGNKKIQRFFSEEIEDPETSILFAFLEDVGINEKKEVIFNDLNLIGISCAKIENHFRAYFTFSVENDED